MGRVLEALKRKTDGRPATPEDSPPRLVLHPEYGGGPAEGEEEGDTIPFIEIGPRRAIEGSPSVLNAPTGRAAKPSPPAPLPVGEKGEDAKPQAGNTAAEEPSHDGAAGHRGLLHSLLAALPGVRRPALLFFAPFAEGESAKIVAGLAVAAAAEGRRVVVIDAGAEGVAGRLGLPRTPGLGDVLAGEASLDRALRSTEHEGLHVLPAGAASGEGVRFVAETMRSLMRQLRQQADLVLVAGPAQVAAGEARLLGVCDGALLVLSEEQAESPRADELLQVVRERGVPVAGCVLVA